LAGGNLLEIGGVINSNYTLGKFWLVGGGLFA